MNVLDLLRGTDFIYDMPRTRYPQQHSIISTCDIDLVEGEKGGESNKQMIHPLQSQEMYLQVFMQSNQEVFSPYCFCVF
jgi:hypothetical protein